MTGNKAKTERFFYTTQELAEGFGVSPRTIRRWVAAKLLEPRFRLLGGNAYQLVFLACEVMRFMDDFLPRPEDFAPNHAPKGRNGRVERIRRLRNLQKLYAGRLNQLRGTREREAALAEGGPGGRVNDRNG